MIRKNSYVPLALCGVHARSDRPLDVCHPLGDFGVPARTLQLRHGEQIIHQLKHPHDAADVDIDVIFPIERLHDTIRDILIRWAEVRRETKTLADQDRNL